MPVVHLIRHGQASFGAVDYDVLSDVGHRQSALLGEALAGRGVRPDRVIAGSLRRQRDTATAWARAAGWSIGDGSEEVDRLELDRRFDEYDHLALMREPTEATAAGRPAPEFGPAGGRAVQEHLDAVLLDWIRTGRPGSDGRSFGQWRDDAVAGQREFLASLGSGGSGLIFSSGGVIAAICADLLGLDPAGFLALNRVVVNTGITKIVGGRGGTSLISFNDHGHLEGRPDLLTYR